MTDVCCRRLKQEILRELERLELVLAQLSEIEAERDAAVGIAGELRQGRPADAPQGHWPGDRDDAAAGGILPQLRQPARGGGLCRLGADAVEERPHRP